VEWLEERLGDLAGGSLRRLRPFLTTARLAAKRQCPCGSGQRAGECHKLIVDEIREAMTPDLAESLGILITRRRNGHE
jgi:hypothetical protein